MPETGAGAPSGSPGVPAFPRADPTDLHRLVRALSPRARVRVARRSGNGWANAYPGTAPLSRLNELDPATPIALHLAAPARRATPGGYRLIAFDLDAARHGPDRAQRDADLLAAILTHLSIAHVPARSGPTGGIHLWTAADPADPAPPDLVRSLARAAARALPTLDPTALLNPATGALRPPLAAHRLGGRSTLTRHTTQQTIDLLSAGTPLHAYQELADLLNARTRTLPPRTAPPPADGVALPPSITARGPATRPITHDPDGHPRLRTTARALTPDARRALRTRPRPHQDHSAHAFTVLLALAHAGFTYAQTRALAANANASPGLEHLRTSRTPGARTPRTSAETDRILTRQWHLAVHAAARTPTRRLQRRVGPAARAAGRLLERIAAAGTERWTRPSGPADRATLLALAALIQATGRLRVDLDVRRLGLMTGYSRQTAAAALTRLMRDGWIRETRPADPTRHLARTLELNPAATHTCPAHPRHTCAIADHEHPAAPVPADTGSDTSANAPREESGAGDGMGLLSDLAADVWSTPGVGHHAARTWAALPRGGARSAEQLSRATGYQPSTTRRHLRVLTHLGLATAAGTGHWVRTALTPAAAGAAARSPAKGVERAAVYWVERAVARWWREEERWLRLPRASKREQLLHVHLRADDEAGQPAARRRAYPRSRAGRPDHAAAWQAEALRLGAPDRLTAALLLNDAGESVDLAALLATGTVRSVLATPPP